MTRVLKEKSYELVVDGKTFEVVHQQIWDKHCPILRWETFINGTPKLGQVRWNYRQTMPSKTEIKKHIENYQSNY